MSAKVRSEKPRADRETRSVVSAGGVVLDEGGRALLLRTVDEGIWCFPKGHVEAGETPREAAAREIEEESGLRCAIDGKVGDVRYSYYWPPEGVNYDKRVLYFLARPIGGTIRLEERFDASRWATPAIARKLLQYRNDRSILQKALGLARISGKS